jgi:isochorismate pyruvate lyase
MPESGLPGTAAGSCMSDSHTPIPPDACSSLADVRREIDRLDDSIVQLLAERGHYVLAAARFKRNAAEVHAPERVEQVISRVRAMAARAGGLPDVVERGYRALIAAFTDAERIERERLG